jgi:3-methyladenine DNA glycosylase AlkD
VNRKILKEIEAHKNLKKGKILSGFFKTGRGQYGEGDIFWGLTVPTSRRIAVKYKDLPLPEVNLLLKNKVHEIRLIGLLVLVRQYKQLSLDKTRDDSVELEKKKIVDFYLKNTRYINNWDLVDLSSHCILGDYLFRHKEGKVLLKLAKSKNLWEQRIAIVSTYAFIRHGDLGWTFKIAKMFLLHEHNLIHKAVGWMLREAGKKDEKVLRKFLDANFFHMPRTMLRYAIEKFPRKIRLSYLKKSV